MHKFLRLVFNFFQTLKINVLPNHFYTSIPDFTYLKGKDFWKKPTSMYGINGIDIDQQFAFTKACVDSIEDKSILQNKEVLSSAVKDQNEEGYGVLEADFLYCFIYKHQPKKIIQIGCGISTSIILRASKDAGYKVDLVCVEPYPSSYLQKLSNQGDITLISEAAQVVKLETLIDLQNGDMFFVDSTHTVKVGSEVNRVILEVLPRLSTGVFVHFHDIFFPYDFQRNINTTSFFWSEGTLLQAFLINNPKYTIRQAQGMLHYEAKKEMVKLFPNYKPQDDDGGLPQGTTQGKHFPAAIYLQVIDDKDPQS